jgi:hypothetical protein
MLTEKEAIAIKAKLARDAKRDREIRLRDARIRGGALATASRERKERRKREEQHRAARIEARESGKTIKPLKKSVFAIAGGAVETNRRKF